MKKFLIVLIMLGIVALMGWAIRRRLASSGDSQQKRQGIPSVAVEVAPVQKTSIRDIGSFTGSLLPKSQFLVAPKIGGRLKQLMVNVGDTVKRDQLIARLDDEEYIQQVEEAQAELQVAGANVEACASAFDVARREFDRVKSLREKKVASESELDAAEADFKACHAKHKVALAQVTQKEAALKAAQIRLSYATVRASWEAGDETRVIGERFVDEGALLKANEPIVSILEDHLLTAVIHVIERDYPEAKAGQEVAISTDAYPERTFAGRIVRIAPLLKESSRQGRVEIDVPNPDRLMKPGMFIRARIEFTRREGATVVPVEALVKRNGKQGVFVADVKTHKAYFVPVTIGIVSAELAEVLKPAMSGQVVTMGQHLLEDGSPITLSNGDKKMPATTRPGDMR
ncbi:MAG: efflux RND transporter periplasmic adaptor subunit [Planctomycetota bacterium]|nr:efflux RND transporter periplasmic adaptor subunit [Planctomycetota bacterium]